MKLDYRYKTWGLGLVAFFLGGCVSTSPLPQTEDLETPQAFNTPQVDQALDEWDERWWEGFNDPLLNELIENAEETAPSLEAALLQLERARLLARLDGAELAPQLAALGSATRSRQSGTTGSAVNPGTTGNRFFAALQLDWEIDPWGRIRKLRDASALEAEAASQAYGYSLVLLRSQIAQLYFAYRAAEQRIGILQATIAVRKEALKLVEIRLESGLSDELEMAQARTEFASASADLERSRAAQASFQNALASLTGRFASDFRISSDGDYEPPIVSAPKAVASETLQRRPDIAEALQLIEAASLRIGAVVAEYYPSLSIGGQFGYASSETSTWFDDPSRLWSLGPSVNLPIFQGRDRAVRLELAENEYRRLFNAYHAQLLKAVEEVENSLIFLQQLALEQKALEDAASSSSRAASLARQRYESGLVSYLEVVDTERAALTAALRLSQVRMERLARLAQLYQELGGGWELESSET